MKPFINQLLKHVKHTGPQLQDKFDQLFGPQGIESQYQYFKHNGVRIQFDFSDTEFNLKNASWLADAALLTYVPNDKDDPLKFSPKYRKYLSNGFVRNIVTDTVESNVEFLSNSGTQCLLIYTDEWIVVAFRGTEVQEPMDVLYDLNFFFDQEENGGVHRGFKNALDAIWDSVEDRLITLTQQNRRRVWFTGHSLGAAIAILAARRWKREHHVQGLYTFGSPGVGGNAFLSTLDQVPSFRIVNGEDIVTTVNQDNFLAHCPRSCVLLENGHLRFEDNRPADRQEILKKVGDLLGHKITGFISSLTSQNVTLPAWLAHHSPRLYCENIKMRI